MFTDSGLRGFTVGGLGFIVVEGVVTQHVSFSFPEFSEELL